VLVPETVHRYPGATLRRGYVVSVLGAAASLAVALAGHENRFVSVICVTIFLLFVAYGLRSVWRGLSPIIVDQEGVGIAGSRRRRIAWNELTGLRLGYYTTRRDGENGWMELSVLGRRRRIRLDSDIRGFVDIARRCHDAAIAHGVALSPATARNFDAVLAGDRTRRRQPDRGAPDRPEFRA